MKLSVPTFAQVKAELDDETVNVLYYPDLNLPHKYEYVSWRLPSSFAKLKEQCKKQFVLKEDIKNYCFTWVEFGQQVVIRSESVWKECLNDRVHELDIEIHVYLATQYFQQTDHAPLKHVNETQLESKFAKRVDDKTTIDIRGVVQWLDNILIEKGVGEVHEDVQWCFLFYRVLKLFQCQTEGVREQIRVEVHKWLTEKKSTTDQLILKLASIIPVIRDNDTWKTHPQVFIPIFQFVLTQFQLMWMVWYPPTSIPPGTNQLERQKLQKT